MATSTEQSIKTEPSMPNASSSEQLTTMKSELNMTTKQEEETFEQFYSEVNLYFC